MKDQALLIIVVIILLTTLSNFNVICHSLVNDFAIGFVATLGFFVAYDLWHTQQSSPPLLR